MTDCNEQFPELLGHGFLMIQRRICPQNRGKLLAIAPANLMPILLIFVVQSIRPALVKVAVIMNRQILAYKISIINQW